MISSINSTYTRICEICDIRITCDISDCCCIRCNKQNVYIRPPSRPVDRTSSNTIQSPRATSYEVLQQQWACFNGVPLVNLLQWCTASGKRTVNTEYMTWSQIVPLRGSVLYSHKKGLMPDSTASGERTMQSRYVSASQSRSKTRARAEPPGLHKESIRSILHSLHQCMPAEADPHVRCLAYSFLVLDFSTISRLSHFIGTSVGPPTVKSHRYWVNEIAIWDERSEISVEHQWRCRMSLSTSRQCVALSLSPLRQYSGERYLFDGVHSTQL